MINAVYNLIGRLRIVVAESNNRKPAEADVFVQ